MQFLTNCSNFSCAPVHKNSASFIWVTIFAFSNKRYRPISSGVVGLKSKQNRKSQFSERQLQISDREYYRCSKFQFCLPSFRKRADIALNFAAQNLGGKGGVTAPLFPLPSHDAAGNYNFRSDADAVCLCRSDYATVVQRA